MNREVHVRNCEGVGVKLPRATRLRDFLINPYIKWSLIGQRVESAHGLWLSAGAPSRQSLPVMLALHLIKT